MSSQKQDDQLIDQLFTGLRDFLNAPLPGTGTAPQKQQPQNTPVVEEESLLEKLKEIMSQPLPGTADETDTAPADNDVTLPVDNKPVARTTASQPSGIEGWNEGLVAPDQKETANIEDWDELKDRHKDEWEALKDRHENERETLKERHEVERDSLKDRHEAERETLKERRKSGKHKHKKRGKGRAGNGDD